MKKTTFMMFAIFFSLLSFMAMTACGKVRDNESLNEQTLLVERQTVRLDGTEDNYFNYFKLGVDVPIRGPEPLLTSVVEFLNEKLYNAFEDVAGISPDEVQYFSSQVYTEDLSNFLYSYAEKYKEAVKKKVTGMYSVNLYLIAQTESFVTYALELCYKVEHCDLELFCYTFSKKDGHLIESVVKEEKLLNYMKKFPEDECLFDAWQLKDSCFNGFYGAALLEKGLLLVNNDSDCHYGVKMLEYKDVFTLLSNEAKSLVKTMGDSTRNNYFDYCIGERMGSVLTHDGERKIILTQTIFFDDWEGDFFEDPDCYNWLCNSDSACLIPDLMAFYLEDNQLVPAPVIEGQSSVTLNYDELCITNPTEYYYAFNPVDNTLYIPCIENVKKGLHNSYDKYKIYQFNGFEFVPRGEEGGFWLHPSLRQFGRLCYYGKSENYMVRVDEMRTYDDRYDGQGEDSRIDTCRYRYAAWKNKYNTQEAPDLIINDGYYSEEKGCYVFWNKGCQYIVDTNLDILKVMRNGKLLKQLDLYDGALYWGNMESLPL